VGETGQQAGHSRRLMEVASNRQLAADLWWHDRRKKLHVHYGDRAPRAERDRAAACGRLTHPRWAKSAASPPSDHPSRKFCARFRGDPFSKLFFLTPATDFLQSSAFSPRQAVQCELSDSHHVLKLFRCSQFSAQRRPGVDVSPDLLFAHFFRGLTNQSFGRSRQGDAPATILYVSRHE
jgi:hypothetical protein